MAFKFNSEEERVAIEGVDESTHPYLDTYNETHWNKSEKSPTRLRQGQISVTGCQYKPEERPDMLPLTIDGLRVSQVDFTAFQGLWSILWSSNMRAARDIVHDDGFRSVVIFGKGDIELALRPLQVDPETGRLL